MSIIRFLVSKNYRVKYTKDLSLKLEWEQRQNEYVYRSVIGESIG